MRRGRQNIFFAVLALTIVLFFVNALPSFAQPLHIPIETPDEDRIFSEFNHHLAGFFLVVVGILAFLSRFSGRLSFAGKVWPFLFILAGLYLALMSDPDVWPMGKEGLFDAFKSNPEARQHKMYSVLLLAMGIIEFQRARGGLGKFAATWSFPILAVFGGVLLFFHQHRAEIPAGMGHAMHGMNHGGHMMTGSMLKIKREHFWFSIVGFCVALFKFIDDGNFWKKPFVPFLWPAFISILGVLLILYTE